MKKVIEVYHGSNISVQNPSLSFGRSDADFGCGFYVSTKLEMAEKWACRKKASVISKYTLDLQGLEIYEFSPDAEWLEFVIDNRKTKPVSPDMDKYDLIIGATADDKLFATIEQYESGFISEATAVEVINCMKIGTQICIRTDKGLNNLQYIGDIHLSPAEIAEIKEQNAKEREQANILTSEIIRKAIAKD
ncbi:MAG: DUF3990 domain-containing protein [Oscillospiraceae bacterium]|nr:DUF3990 domain-containing protein [Oscillospiraceae bacterium]